MWHNWQESCQDHLFLHLFSPFLNVNLMQLLDVDFQGELPKQQNRADRHTLPVCAKICTRYTINICPVNPHFIPLLRLAFVLREIISHRSQARTECGLGSLHTIALIVARLLLWPLGYLNEGFIIFVWAINFHSVKQLFQVAGTEDRTTDPWITRPVLYPYTMGTELIHLISLKIQIMGEKTICSCFVQSEEAAFLLSLPQ